MGLSCTGWKKHHSVPHVRGNDLIHDQGTAPEHQPCHNAAVVAETEQCVHNIKPLACLAAVQMLQAAPVLRVLGHSDKPAMQAASRTVA